MSQSPAASLHTGLLASKGNAQPSRGVAHPLIERLASAVRPSPSLSPSPVPPIVNAPHGANIAGQSRLSVRIDEKQQLRLRLASAHLGKNRQTLLIEALDHYLNQVMPTFLHEPCPCIEGGDGETGHCHHSKT